MNKKQFAAHKVNEDLTVSLQKALDEMYNTLGFLSFVEPSDRARWVAGYWEENRLVDDKRVFESFKEVRMAYQDRGFTGMYVGKENGWVKGRLMMNISIQEVEQEMSKYPAMRPMEQIMNDLLLKGVIR